MRFTGIVDGGSYFRTSDEDVQKALENSSSFGVDYTLYSVSQRDQGVVEDPANNTLEQGVVELKSETSKNKNETEQVEPVEILEDVTTITGAREVLRAKGVDYRRLNSPKSILKQAAENNVEFPNLIIE